MNTRKVALVHGKKGPWIATRGMKNPMIRISGLRTGTVVVATDCFVNTEVAAAGDHPVPEAEWMQVLYDGPDRVLCHIICKVA